MARDARTRWQGVYVRHQQHCRAPDGARCSCRPGYMARVYDPRAGRQLRSSTFRSGAAAASWRRDTIAKLERGELPALRTELRLGKAAERFVVAAREGSVLTKHGRRYRPSTIDDLENALAVHVLPELGAKRLSDLRRGEIHHLVDRLGQILSGSRVRSVVTALRSLFRWAQDRELVAHNPASVVRLPAMNAKPRDRVAAPAEFAELLAVLETEDALPFALAAYATARRQELRLLRWTDVDLDGGTLRLGADVSGRKTDAAMRLVPVVKRLASLLRDEYQRQDRPPGDELVCRPRHVSASGLLSATGVMKRARRRWAEHTLEPIANHATPPPRG